MTEKQRARLQAAVDTLRNLRANDVDAKSIVQLLIRDHGASLRQRDGAYHLRFGGHAASCTHSADAQLLSNWTNSAGLKLIGAAQGGFGKDR